MTDYTKKCWYCGSLDLEKKDDHVQCTSCGATYNALPEPVFSPLSEHGEYVNDQIRSGRLIKRKPSKTAIRQARKARQLTHD